MSLKPVDAKHRLAVEHRHTDHFINEAFSNVYGEETPIIGQMHPHWNSLQPVRNDARPTWSNDISHYRGDELMRKEQRQLYFKREKHFFSNINILVHTLGSNCYLHRPRWQSRVTADSTIERPSLSNYPFILCSIVINKFSSLLLQRNEIMKSMRRGLKPTLLAKSLCVKKIRDLFINDTKQLFLPTTQNFGDWY